MKYSQDPGHIGPALQQLYEDLNLSKSTSNPSHNLSPDLEETKTPVARRGQKAKTEPKIPPVNKNVDPFANLSDMSVDIQEESDASRVAEMLDSSYNHKIQDEER